jgi:hypothetical protein
MVGYLVVDIQREGNQTLLKQEGLTKRIIEALGLDSKYSTPVDTLTKSAALGQDVDGKEASGSINYASVVGMLLYLSHSQPNISFATHQCARYNHSPKQSHEDALKRIRHCLKGTVKRGLYSTQVVLSKLSVIQMRLFPACGCVTTSTTPIASKAGPAM